MLFKGGMVEVLRWGSVVRWRCGVYGEGGREVGRCREVWRGR